MAGYSILDVAKKAGVSKSTVSRVLTGGSVSEKAAKAVKKAMEELTYTPNRNAQALRGAATRTIGVALTDKDSLLKRSMATRIAGMNHIFAQNGYSVLLINGQNNSQDTVPTALHFLENSRVDGLIFLGDVEDEAQRSLLTQYREVVYTGERIDQHKGFRVYLGNYYYSRDLYLYLLNHGHSKVLTVYEAPSKRLFERRNAAYRQVCEMFHRKPAENNFLCLSDMEDGETNKTETIYRQFCEGGFSAVFADSTELGNQIVNVFSQHGLILKKDYSLVAIQRAADAGIDPLITGVCLPDFEYGLQTAQLMLRVIQHPELEYEDIQIPYSIEVRSSVKNISD